MLTVIKRICTKRFIEKIPVACRTTNFSTALSTLPVKFLFCDEYQRNLQFCRYKSKGKKKSTKQDSETETEKESDKDFMDDIQDKYTKTVKVNVTSMRLDVILKAGLGLSRNKLETIFYESKIRLNGEKVLKKSVHVQEGDEIDVIKGVNINNKELLTVAKVEILGTVPKEENISVKMRRSKSLTVENYQGNHRWEE